MTAGALFALVSASMLADTDPNDGAGWAAGVVSLVLLVLGTILRMRKRTEG
jgi:hypothetical protein